MSEKNPPKKTTMSDAEKQFLLGMAEVVWLQVKGYPIPDCYSEEDRLDIFERYYHRAVAQSQGE
jgi:glucose-6-phosphate isomerase